MIVARLVIRNIKLFGHRQLELGSILFKNYGVFCDQILTERVQILIINFFFSP